MTVKVVGWPDGACVALRAAVDDREPGRLAGGVRQRVAGPDDPTDVDDREQQPEEHGDDKRELDQGLAGRTNTTAPRHSRPWMML